VRKRLGEILVEHGWITGEQLIRALRAQRVVGGLVSTCLLEMGALSEDLLLAALGEQTGLPTASAEELRSIPAEIVGLAPAKLALTSRAVPFRTLGGRVDVAMVNVRDLTAQDELAFVTGKRVVPHVAIEVRVFEALERFYGLECPSRYAHILDRLNRARFMGERQVGSGAPTSSFLDTVPLVPEPTWRSAEEAFAPPPPAATPPPRTPEPPRSSHSPPLGLPALEERLATVTDPEEVGRAFLDLLAGHLGDAALFRVRKDTVEGWMATPGLERAGGGRFESFRLRLNEASIFLNLSQGGSFHLGPLAAMPAHERLAATLGTSCLNGNVLFLPVRLPMRPRDRLVAVGYGPGRKSDGEAADLELLQRGAAKVAIAFELCILRAKLRQA
jgi:hypothetical protein